MSVMALFMTEQGPLIAADGACSDLDGNMRGLQSKIVTYPERDAMIAWCGIGKFGHCFTHEINQQYPSFDDLVECFSLICRQVHMRLMIGEGYAALDEDLHKVSIVLAGYSQARQGYEAYRTVSYPKESKNSATGETTVVKPWSVQPIEYFFASYSPADTARERFKLDDIGTDASAYLMRFICAARSESGTLASSGGNYNAGGFVQFAHLQPGTIRSWIAHRWPDEIGKPIDPEVGEPLPEWANVPTPDMAGAA